MRRMKRKPTMMKRRNVMMKNKILSVMLCLIPFYVSYAIVSDLGKPQHHYHSVDSAVQSD